MTTRRKMKAEEKYMKNKLIDLNNHLFAQIERLADEETKGDKLTEEIERSKAIGFTAQKIIDNARLALDAQKALSDTCWELPPMLGIERKTNIGIEKKK
jgi:hypothetical protein